MTWRAPPPRVWGVSAFHLAGAAGLVAACAVAFGLVAMRGLNWKVMALIVVLAVITFLVVALAAKLVHGEERLVALHQLLAVLAVTALGLWTTGAPIVAYLEVTALGVAVLIACGRLGCLAVGCCHGRVSRIGVVYRDAHAAQGFPAELTGVPLLPVPVLESVALVVLVSTGDLVWLLSGYALTRVWLEGLRGDPAAGSQRMLALAMSAGVVVATWLGVPGREVATAGFLLALVLALASFPVRGNADLVHGRHLTHLAGAVRACLPPPADGSVVTTVSACGVIVSACDRAGRLTIAASPVPAGREQQLAFVAAGRPCKHIARRGALVVLDIT